MWDNMASFQEKQLLEENVRLHQKVIHLSFRFIYIYIAHFKNKSEIFSPSFAYNLFKCRKLYMMLSLCGWLQCNLCYEQTVLEPWRGSTDQQEKFRVIDLNLEVETDLVIGLPEKHCK